MDAQDSIESICRRLAAIKSTLSACLVNLPFCRFTHSLYRDQDIETLVKMVKIAIIYYSMYGHVATLAKAEKKGIEAAGGQVDVYQ